MSVEELCEGILKYLQRMRRPLIIRLQQGIRYNVLNKKLESVGLDLPTAVRCMYSWRNGTIVYENDILDHLYFFPGFYWLSLEDAIDTYNALIENNQWVKTWFPLFASGGGDYYAVVCEDSENLGSVIGFVRGDELTSIEYRSLETMLVTIKSCYEKEIFYLSEEGFLESDDASYFEVARKNNPSLIFYKDSG